MAAFLSGLGSALVDQAKQKFYNKAAGQVYAGATDNGQMPQTPPDPNDPAAGMEYAKYRAAHSPIGSAIAGGMNRYRHQQSPQIPSQETADSLQPVLQDQGSGDLAGVMPDPMAHGRMVTKPTVALLGERGPEAVVPMNADPHNKVSMPPVPGILRPPEIPQARFPRYRR